MREPLDSKPIITVYFDGLCEPKNPGGVATYGFIVTKSGKKMYSEHGLAYAKPWTDEASNNVAEYSALIHALKWLRDHDYTDARLILRGDSRLIINQINGVFKVKAIRIVELYKRAMELLSFFPDSHAEWIEREQNKEADLLSRIAYSKFTRTRKK